MFSVCVCVCVCLCALWVTENWFLASAMDSCHKRDDKRRIRRGDGKGEMGKGKKREHKVDTGSGPNNVFGHKSK